MLDAFRKTPLPITLAILSFISPTELSLVVGDLRLSAHRVVFLIFIPFALYRLALRPDCRLKLYDVPFFGLAIWQIFAFTYHGGQAGFIFGGSAALESLGAYAIARAYIRDLETLQAAMRIVFYSIVLAALIALLDTLTGTHFIHELLRKALGGPPLPPVEFRKGIVRAASTFDHPIHYGTYCAAMFALIWMCEPKKTWRYVRAAGIGVAAFLAMSSAPLLSLSVQCAMMAWNRFTVAIPFRVQITLAVLVGLYLGVLLVSNRPPVQILISVATFDPWTGYYRMLIWEYGLENVWGSPWVGIGLADWERPKWMYSSTIDAYWLVLALRTGIPAFLLVASGHHHDLLRRRDAGTRIPRSAAPTHIGGLAHFAHRDLPARRNGALLECAARAALLRSWPRQCAGRYQAREECRVAIGPTDAAPAPQLHPPAKPALASRRRSAG